MKKHPESHMDHGFTQEQWDYIFTKYADKTAFFIETIELPEHLGTVTNELYGPTAGDPPVAEQDVFYAKRGDRKWDSRLVKLPKRPTKFVRVIAGPHEEKCTGCAGTGVAFCEPPSVTVTTWCKPCGGTGTVKHACILYTAYGVASLDMPAAPKEPGDLEMQLAALNTRTYDEAANQRLKLQSDLEVSRPFWSVHGLAHEGT